MSAALLLLHAPSTGLLSPAHAQQLVSQRSFSNDNHKHALRIDNGGLERERSTARTCAAVRKMMGNEEEMFFQHFWHFDLEPPNPPKEFNPNTIKAPHLDSLNASLILPLQHPLALHHITDIPPSHRHWARGLLHPQLWDRAFQCPSVVSSSPTPDKATLHVAAADRHAPERFKTALKDTKPAQEPKAEDAVYQDMSAWAPWDAPIAPQLP
ncbi:MAG: hypothetical protein Q9186_002051 [Xanthomendoza sp. 1 TL-2023]